MTLSDTIDFLAKNVQAGIVIDFDRPPQEDIGLGKNAGPRWLKWKTLGHSPSDCNFEDDFPFPKVGWIRSMWQLGLEKRNYPS